MKKLRIFLACEHQRLRVALLLLLDEQPGMSMVGIADGLPELLPQIAATRPDVLLLEWKWSDLSLANLLTELHNPERPLKIVLFSNDPDDEEPAMAAGVDRFILENAPPDGLLPILQEYRASVTGVSKEHVEDHPDKDINKMKAMQ